MTQPKALGPDIQQLYTYYELPIGATAIGLPPGRSTGLWRYTKPLFRVKVPPCQHACPAGNWIQKFIAKTGAEQFDDAWEALTLENPFPGLCGRVCYHPCELSCNRQELDGATAIHSAERYLADHFFQQPLTPPLIREKQHKKVAIVGSGPAGLACAYFLIMMGYETIVYEANNELGGMPQIGIPRYRLPKQILDKEINDILALGVEVRKGRRIGKDLPFKELLAYDAVFLATGAHRAARLDIPILTQENIYQGLDFLAQNNLGQPPELAKKVLVIGGGNVAIDVCRTLIRRGCAPALLYRRTRNEMPAHHDEICDAEDEGLQCQYLLAPTSVRSSKSGGISLECTKMKLTGTGPDGRPQVAPLAGEAEFFEADQIILATGEIPDLSYLPNDVQVSDGLVQVNATGQTSIEKVFAGGDIAGQPWTVAAAIGSAKRAAIGIDHYLRGDDLQALIGQGEIAKTMRVHLGIEAAPASDAQELADFQDLNLAHTCALPSHTSEKMPVDERICDFSEVDCGLETTSAVEEARRCLSCGVCRMCGNCYLFCPDGAIEFDPTVAQYIINYDYCKGCGICFRECPVGTICVKTEEER
ncbi:MAG: FAD-dependent oxidoreductase [Desulfobacterales bacterium]|nr:MAG: FAD-dependent oxidoreductase [Desulfobacterales bacterium]